MEIANGKTWKEVVIDLTIDSWRNAKSAWNKVAEPFRHEKPSEKQDV